MRLNRLLPGLLLALAACKSVPTTRLSSLDVQADADANGGYATALDVVFVFTTAAAAALPPTGPEWFDRRAALQADLADAVKVVHVQLPPARSAVPDLPPGYDKAVGVYSFANYIPVRGQARANLTPYRRVTIRLAKDRIDYVQH